MLRAPMDMPAPVPRPASPPATPRKPALQAQPLQAQQQKPSRARCCQFWRRFGVCSTALDSNPARVIRCSPQARNLFFSRHRTTRLAIRRDAILLFCGFIKGSAVPPQLWPAPIPRHAPPRGSRDIGGGPGGRASPARATSRPRRPRRPRPRPASWPRPGSVCYRVLWVVRSLFCGVFCSNILGCTTNILKTKNKLRFTC